MFSRSKPKLTYGSDRGLPEDFGATQHFYDFYPTVLSHQDT